ncbi:GNAT family N-acetyltransferase [Lacticaseibacillus yichunensis]|uniref:GNAT family N-acetyltransferase n=1 Tax=Lacticaseibacillus yichunensis TaxID=2486015 RepID=A0ABW4CMV6_9LACO|nr:GNAT family N-acetyltransferase [Lacticaseibacillus yichunensis]
MQMRALTPADAAAYLVYRRDTLAHDRDNPYNQNRIRQMTVEATITPVLARIAQAARPDETGMRQRTLYLFDDANTAILGRVSMRTHLSPAMRGYAGHIGYDVAPSARGRGLAKWILRDAVAQYAGVVPFVIVSAAVGNLASQHVIESCGGQSQGIHERDGERYYLYQIPTTQA